MRERPPPRVETLVQVVARQVSHAAHVEIRKPENKQNAQLGLIKVQEKPEEDCLEMN